MGRVFQSGHVLMDILPNNIVSYHVRMRYIDSDQLPMLCLISCPKYHHTWFNGNMSVFEIYK